MLLIDIHNYVINAYMYIVRACCEIIMRNHTISGGSREWKKGGSYVLRGGGRGEGGVTLGNVMVKDVKDVKPQYLYSNTTLSHRASLLPKHVVERVQALFPVSWAE